MQTSSDAEDEYILWNSQIRELLVMFILSSILGGLAFSIIKYFRRPSTPLEEERNTVSFFLSSACLAVTLGSVLLVPTTIVCHDVLLMLPNNYYLQWLSRHLVYTLWNRIFWASNVCFFLLLPMAYFYHEASGFGQSFKGVMWRILESFIVWLLFTAILGGFIFLARSLYASSQATPDYSPFAYSLMSLVGSLFILWYTPGGVVVLGRSSIDLFRTYKVLVPANRQELLFESDSLRFKLQKIDIQKRSLGPLDHNTRFSEHQLAPTTSRPRTAFNRPVSAIWTKSLLLPTPAVALPSSERRTLFRTPSHAYQHVLALQQQLINSSNRSNTSDISLSSPSEFMNGRYRSSAPDSVYDAATVLLKGVMEFERDEETIRPLLSTIEKHEVVTEEFLEKSESLSEDPRDSVEEQISALRWLVEQGYSSTSANGEARRGFHLDSQKSSVSDFHSYGMADKLPPAQDIDWNDADTEYEAISKRLKVVEAELSKYSVGAERTTLMSSIRWLLRNVMAIVLSTINLILPLLLFVRAIDVQLRPLLATEGAVYYYSFLYPEESSSTAWFTTEMALITYLTCAAFTGLFTSGFMARFRPHKQSTGVRRIIVSIYLCLVLASALPVVGRILGLISFDLMGAYDNMGYLKNQLLTSSMQTIFALLLVKRYLEFFPWTNYVIRTISRAFDWANRPLLTS